MEKKTLGITAVLMLISAGLYPLYENIDWTKEVYYCETRVELGPQYCNRFSTSGVRCYPNELDNKGYKDCSVGWTELTNDMIMPIENTVTPVTTGGSWCYDYGCIPKEE